MNISKMTKKHHLPSLDIISSFIVLRIAMGGQQAQAGSLFSDRTTFQNNLDTFITDDFL